MDQDIREKIKEIVGKIECKHDFCCLKTGFDRPCKAKDIGLKAYLECLEEDTSLCAFSVSFGSIYFCSCPLRIYICKKLGK